MILISNSVIYWCFLATNLLWNFKLCILWTELKIKHIGTWKLFGVVDFFVGGRSLGGWDGWPKRKRVISECDSRPHGGNPREANRHLAVTWKPISFLLAQKWMCVKCRKVSRWFLCPIRWEFNSLIDCYWHAIPPDRQKTRTKTSKDRNYSVNNRSQMYLTTHAAQDCTSKLINIWIL
jgi:hypothetical protein